MSLISPIETKEQQPPFVESQRSLFYMLISSYVCANKEHYINGRFIRMLILIIIKRYKALPQKEAEDPKLQVISSGSVGYATSVSVIWSPFVLSGFVINLLYRYRVIVKFIVVLINLS
ncbi:hypothetical protein LOAG_10258 [Loa loa]|uniref:Uncharacterized protein n=1 Tax=Loa loa TaxID=7209 RepID=A0A1S0TQS4_LOALO|nr:hypothetical protein LOAG_10258 [Loa loa]EFO18238.2 hypothetical protein LOAG_10258 [Loa loa]